MHILNIDDFGAVGDQITDDRAAIQRALDACAEGDAIVGSRGKTYCISAPIVVDRPNLTIRDISLTEKS